MNFDNEKRNVTEALQGIHTDLATLSASVRAAEAARKSEIDVQAERIRSEENLRQIVARRKSLTALLRGYCIDGKQVPSARKSGFTLAIDGIVRAHISPSDDGREGLNDNGLAEQLGTPTAPQHAVGEVVESAPAVDDSVHPTAWMVMYSYGVAFANDLRSTLKAQEPGGAMSIIETADELARHLQGSERGVQALVALLQSCENLPPRVRWYIAEHVVSPLLLQAIHTISADGKSTLKRHLKSFSSSGTGSADDKTSTDTILEKLDEG
jgi:hypothetical protein